MLTKNKRLDRMLTFYPGRYINIPDEFSYPPDLSEPLRRHHKILTEEQIMEKKIEAETRRYDRERCQKMVNEYLGRHNAFFYLDY